MCSGYLSFSRFLWVYFQLQDLYEAASDADIRNILEHLPNGLHETYWRMLTKVSKSPNVKLAQRAFRWIACARRPLELRELQEAVAFGLADDKWDSEKIPDGDKLVRSCYGLIVRDQDFKVRFAHHTVLKFLTKLDFLDDNHATSQENKAGRTNSLDSFFFSLSEGEAMLQIACAVYLCFSDFESALVRTEKERNLTINTIFRQGGPIAIPAVLGLDKSVYRISHRFFSTKNNAEVLDLDFAKYIDWERFQRRPPPELGDKYALLSYIVEFWPWHTRIAIKLSRIAFLDPTIDQVSGDWSREVVHLFKTFWNLILFKALRFEIRPWGPNQHFGPYGCKGCPVPEYDDNEGSKRDNGIVYSAKELPHMALVHYAAQTGHVPLLALIGDRIRDYIRHEQYHEETLMMACRCGHSNVVDYLMQWYPEYDVTDCRAVGEICKNGSVDTLKSLLGIEDDANLSSEQNAKEKLSRCIKIRNGDAKQNPLTCAAFYGNDDMVKFLIELGLETDFKDEPLDMTALHYAAMNGRDQIVTTLSQLSKFRGTIDLRNRSSETPLILAARNGHATVVWILQDAGADIWFKGGEILPLPDVSIQPEENEIMEILQFSIRTAIYYATANGHLGTLEALLKIQDLSRKSLVLQDYPWNSHRLHLLESLQTAALYGRVDCAWLLLRALASLASPDWDMNGHTALELAARFNRVEVIRLLLENRADPNKIVWDSGYNALHFAAIFGSVEAVITLLDGSVRLNGPNNSTTVVKANINARTDQGSSSTNTKGLHSTTLGNRGK